MANIQPQAPHTIGNAITEAEAAMRERLAVLEAAALKDEKTAVAWLKSNWSHIVTWVGTSATLLKLFGKI
jgi:hypothetical protein